MASKFSLNYPVKSVIFRVNFLLWLKFNISVNTFLFLMLFPLTLDVYIYIKI